MSTYSKINLIFIIMPYFQARSLSRCQVLYPKRWFRDLSTASCHRRGHLIAPREGYFPTTDTTCKLFLGPQNICSTWFVVCWNSRQSGECGIQDPGRRWSRVSDNTASIVFDCQNIALKRSSIQWHSGQLRNWLDVHLDQSTRRQNTSQLLLIWKFPLKYPTVLSALNLDANLQWFISMRPMKRMWVRVHSWLQ